jgi:hypothetical protein
MIGKAFVAIVGGLLLLGSGCGDGAEAEPGSYAEMLRFVPEDSGYRRQVAIVDYAALLALPLPGDAPANLTAVERLRLVSRHCMGGGFIAPLGSRGALPWDEIRENWELGFGFTVDDFERQIHFTNFGASPDQMLGSLGIAAGKFDADAVPGRLASCGECEPPAEIHEYDGWTILSWPEGISLEPEERLAPPMRDNLGRGGHISITDELVVRGDWIDDFTAVLDAYARGESEREEDPFQVLTTELEQLAPLTVILSEDHQGPEWAEAMAAPNSQLSAKQNEDMWLRYNPPTSEVRLRPYVAFALAASVEDLEPVMTILLVHESEAEAAANVARLGERLEVTRTWDELPWSEVFESWSISAEGRVLTATLRGLPRWAMVIGGELLLLHE